MIVNKPVEMWRDPTLGNSVDWMASAPNDEMERRDFFIALIARLSFEVSRQTMEECVAKSLPSHGVKRGEPHD